MTDAPPIAKSKPEKVNFTKAVLDAATCPPGRDRVYLYDAKTPGLAFLITDKGSRTFYLYRRIDNRPERLKLGKYPGLTIEQARTNAAIENGKIAQGRNPQQERRTARGDNTLSELFSRYLENHAKPHKKSWAQDEDQFDRYLEGWKARKLASIKQDDVQRLHTSIGTKHGPYSANRVLALLSVMFAKAAPTLNNPARGIQRFKEQKRERFLQPDEVPAFFAALKSEPNDMLRDFFTLSVLVGARRSNMQSMRWDDVNLTRAVWTVRADEAKGGEQMTIILPAPALDILKARKASAKNGSVYVFPSHGKTGHLSEPKAAWKSLLKRAEIKELRLHDLRRTLGSWQAAAGASLSIIGKSLGHKDQATTAIYARLHIDPVRDSVEKATAALMAASVTGSTDQKGDKNAPAK
jgi:integrase